MKKVSLIVPCYNEERNLDALYAKLRPLLDNSLDSRKYEWEVIMIDDGSRDSTLSLMESLSRRMKESTYCHCQEILARNVPCLPDSIMLRGTVR